MAASEGSEDILILRRILEEAAPPVQRLSRAARVVLVAAAVMGTIVGSALGVIIADTLQPATVSDGIAVESLAENLARARGVPVTEIWAEIRKDYGAAGPQAMSRWTAGRVGSHLIDEIGTLRGTRS